MFTDPRGSQSLTPGLVRLTSQWFEHLHNPCGTLRQERAIEAFPFAEPELAGGVVVVKVAAGARSLFPVAKTLRLLKQRDRQALNLQALGKARRSAALQAAGPECGRHVGSGQQLRQDGEQKARQVPAARPISSVE